MAILRYGGVPGQFAWKDAVRVATTAAGTLASDFEAGDIIDGITLIAGDDILIKNQVTQSENGIYTVQTTGAPVRRSDANTPTDINGATVFAREGTTNANTAWFQNQIITTLGIDNIVFVQAFGVGLYLAGTGLTLTGNTFSSNLSTGVAGGQSVIGGTAAGNDLTLVSTSHGTKGSLFADALDLSPLANDQATLGTASLGWADLYGASGFTLNLAADWVATHTAGILTVGTGDLRVTTAGTNTASVVTVGGAQTLTNKSLTSAVVTGFTAGSILFAGVGAVITQDNTNLFFDDTNNRLGLGTTSPSYRLHIYGAGTANWGLTNTSAPASNQTFNMFIANADGAFWFRDEANNATFVLAQQNARTTAHTGATFANVATSSTGSITKTGVSISSTGTWNGASAVNQALYLNATGGTTNVSIRADAGLAILDDGVNVGNSSQATATTLDYYEEGTWTPVLTADTPPSTPFTYDIQVGRYTRVGNLVTLVCSINLATMNATGAAGNWKITGLPFTPVTVTNLQWQGSVGWAAIDTGATTVTVTSQILSADASVYFRSTEDGTGSFGFNWQTTNTTLDANSSVWVTIQYQVAT